MGEPHPRSENLLRKRIQSSHWGWVLKLASLAWRLAPLIVVFSCRDDITAPVSRLAGPLRPTMAQGVAGISAQVSAGGFHTCTVNTAGSVLCWGREDVGQTHPPADLLPVSQLSTGYRHNCAVEKAGGLRCWGQDTFGQSTVPTDLTSVLEVRAASYHTCALKTDRTVECWGQDAPEVHVPSGLNSVSQVSTVTYHSCAL